MRPLEIQAIRPGMQIFQVPSLQTILSDKSGLRQYPLTAAYADAEDNILCIIHSSGTTGRSSMSPETINPYPYIRQDCPSPFLSPTASSQPSTTFPVSLGQLVVSRPRFSTWNPRTSSWLRHLFSI